MEDAKRLVANHIYHNQSVLVAVLFCNTLMDYCVDGLNEILEWWLVSDWLAERLKAEGEVVLEEYNCHWWGRQSSGQAIYMDWVIEKISR